MSSLRRNLGREEGFTFQEILVVLLGGSILLALGVPVATTVSDQFRLSLAAQSISSQMLFAKMKAVSSNEPFNVVFPDGQSSYRVETSNGTVISGPFVLPPGITWNTSDGGPGISFPGRYVTFVPTGNVPLAGNGSPGRVKIINQSRVRVDIVVSSGGVVRQTPFFKTSTPPF